MFPLLSVPLWSTDSDLSLAPDLLHFKASQEWKKNYIYLEENDVCVLIEVRQSIFFVVVHICYYIAGYHHTSNISVFQLGDLRVNAWSLCWHIFLSKVLKTTTKSSKMFTVFLTGLSGQNPITKMLVPLDWLPVRFRYHFKIFTFKASLSLAP